MYIKALKASKQVMYRCTCTSRFNNKYFLQIKKTECRTANVSLHWDNTAPRSFPSIVTNQKVNKNLLRIKKINNLSRNKNIFKSFIT